METRSIDDPVLPRGGAASPPPPPLGNCGARRNWVNVQVWIAKVGDFRSGKLLEIGIIARIGNRGADETL